MSIPNVTTRADASLPRSVASSTHMWLWLVALYSAAVVGILRAAALERALA